MRRCRRRSSAPDKPAASTRRLVPRTPTTAASTTFSSAMGSSTSRGLTLTPPLISMSSVRRGVMSRQSTHPISGCPASRRSSTERRAPPVTPRRSTASHPGCSSRPPVRRSSIRSGADLASGGSAFPGDSPQPLFVQVVLDTRCLSGLRRVRSSRARGRRRTPSRSARRTGRASPADTTHSGARQRQVGRAHDRR